MMILGDATGTPHSKGIIRTPHSKGIIRTPEAERDRGEAESILRENRIKL
jgi:hypothetical protein